MALNAEDVVEKKWPLGTGMVDLSECWTVPISIYGFVSPDWLWKLRRMVEVKDRAEVPDYTLAKNTLEVGSQGFCYLYRGEANSNDIRPVTSTFMKGVIEAFVHAGCHVRPTRALTFLPGSVYLDTSHPDWDMLAVKAHDTYFETSELITFNKFIDLHFKEFHKEGKPYFPQVDVMAVKKGVGAHYADTLNAAALWQAVTFGSLYIEIGGDLYNEVIR